MTDTYFTQNTSKWPGCPLWNNCRGGGGKGKKVNVDFKPFEPMSISLGVTDSIEAFVAWCSVTAVWPCVMDGSRVFFAALQGNTREVPCEFSGSLEVREQEVKLALPPIATLNRLRWKQQRGGPNEVSLMFGRRGSRL